jgi:hypothetical protein
MRATLLVACAAALLATLQSGAMAQVWTTETTLQRKWEASIRNCGLTTDIQGLGPPLSTKPCVDPSVDALPGQRSTYDGLWRPSCNMHFMGPDEACAALRSSVDRIIVLGGADQCHQGPGSYGHVPPGSCAGAALHPVAPAWETRCPC